MRGRPFRKGISGNPGGRPKVLSEVRELARAHGAGAVAELGRLALKAKSEAVRVAACRELLDRGYGKPEQHASVDLDKRDATDWTTDELVAFLNDCRARGGQIDPADGGDGET
jgi:hypothetical protein